MEKKKLYPMSVSPINVQYSGRYGYNKESPLRSEIKLKLKGRDESPKERMISKHLDKLN